MTVVVSQGLRTEMAIPGPHLLLQDPKRAFQCPWLPGLGASKGNELVPKIPGEFSFPPSLKGTPQGTQ